MDVLGGPLFSLPRGLREHLAQSSVLEKYKWACFVRFARIQLSWGCFLPTVKEDLAYKLEALVFSHTHLKLRAWMVSPSDFKYRSQVVVHDPTKTAGLVMLATHTSSIT